MQLFLRPLTDYLIELHQLLKGPCNRFKLANIWEGRGLSAQNHPTCSRAFVTPKSLWVTYPSFNTGRKKTHSCLAPAPSSAICHILVSPRRHLSSVLHSPILGELEQKTEFPVFRTTLRSLCSIYDPLVFSISPTGRSRLIWPECQVG